RDARHADRHGEGPHAPGAREAAPPAVGRPGGADGMTVEHDGYQEEVGAFLLGALEPDEQAAFERHLAGCPECRAEVEELRVAADALPRSVEPFAAPPSLKRSLMAAVNEDARPARKPLLARLGLENLFRPQFAMAGAALLLVVAVL